MANLDIRTVVDCLPDNYQYDKKLLIIIPIDIVYRLMLEGINVTVLASIMTLKLH